MLTIHDRFHYIFKYMYMYKIYSIIIYLIKKIKNCCSPHQLQPGEISAYSLHPHPYHPLSHHDPLCCPTPSTESPPLGQLSPATSADYIGTKANHTNWKNSRLHRHRCKLQAQAQAIAVGRKDG